MWKNNSNSDHERRGFLTPPAKWKSAAALENNERKPIYPQTAPKPHLFHVIHKVPSGSSPYVRAKHVQLIDKDPSKAISLFWAAINSGDRVDSALKDMAVVMKQLNRSDEAIEAIKSFRHLCPSESQESIDNILIELYKRSGRIEEEIELLELKLKDVEEGIAFGGKKTKIARSQGKKVQITIEKEYSRLLGNLAWSHMQLKNYKSAEEYYRKALSLEPDKNKQSNLAICLMHMNKITEAKFLIQSIKASDKRQMDESCTKSFERATQMLAELELHGTCNSKEQQEKICEQIPGSSTLFGHNKSNGDVRTHPSSCSAAGTPDEFFTQPRRFSCSLNERNLFTKDTASACSRRLLFEQTTNNENVQSVANNNSNKLISGKEMNKVSQISGQVLYRPWGNGANIKIESTLQPHCDKWRKNSSDTWRNNENVQSVANDNLNKLISGKEMNNVCHLSGQVLYRPWRNDANMKNESTLQTHCDKWKRNSSENDGTDKISPELSNSPPQPLADNTSARKYSEDGGKDYLSTLTSSDTVTLTDTTEPLESTNLKRLDSSACKSKKSWADMVEEDELRFQFYETPIKYSDGNENVDSNIINLDQSFESLCMSEGYHTQPGPVVKRSLCFGQQDRNENCSSRLQGKEFKFGSLPPIGDIANHTPGKLLRRNRLQVFQDITPETPKP